MKKENRQILLISELAFRNITILLLSVLIGIKLDEYFDTKPIFIIVFSIMVVAYLLCSLFVLGKKQNEL